MKLITELNETVEYIFEEDKKSGKKNLAITRSAIAAVSS